MSSRTLPILLGVLALVFVGCSSGTPAKSPSPSLGASALPSPSGAATVAPTVDESFCGTVATLQDALSAFRSVKVKPANKAQIKSKADSIKVVFGDIQSAAPDAVKGKVAALAQAVDGIVLAAEDYKTTSRPANAEARLKTATTKLVRAIDSLRSAAACTN